MPDLGQTMPGPVASKTAGFSLLEVLVALTIMSLLAGAVVLTLSSRPSAAQTQAERLLLLMNAATEDSLTTGALIGFAADVDSQGYKFFSYQDGSWRTLTDHPGLAPYRFDRPDLQLVNDALGRRESLFQGRNNQDLPEVFFDPTGVNMPITYRFEGPRERVFLTRDSEGQMRLRAEPKGQNDER